MQDLGKHSVGNDLLDKEQEGVHQNRSTAYTVGGLAQSIIDGTAAVFVDLASAYNSVERRSLLQISQFEDTKEECGVGSEIF